MNMYETHGTVHSDSTVVVLLLATQTLQSLSTFCNAICYQHRHQPHVRCYSLPISSIRSPSQLITSNFPSILIVFRQFFTCIALDDVDSHFSLILVTKAIAVEGGTTPAAWLHHRYQDTRVCADGRQHRGCIMPQDVTHSLVLLKMGKIISRNMLSWLELLISRYCCI